MKTSFIKPHPAFHHLKYVPPATESWARSLRTSTRCEPGSFLLMKRSLSKIFAVGACLPYIATKCNKLHGICNHYLTVFSQARPNQPQQGLLSLLHLEKEGSGDFRERKGLVTFGRFPCAMSQLPHRQSDWLRSHNSELISMCETTESEERGG